MLYEVEKFLGDAPEGALNVKSKNGKVYFYHQIKNQEKKKVELHYLGKTKLHHIKKLAQKSYLKKVRSVLKEQLSALKQFEKSYEENAVEEIYEALPEERKMLVTPVERGVRDKLRNWNEETYEPYNAYPEYKIYETDRGEIVRSKSEVIIANLLYKHRKDLDYKYERPLKLRAKNGEEITIHPDFTIINKHTGKIYYYEHAGKMDDPKYATDFVKKMELYMANNIWQGKELLVTYEAAGAPLSTTYVRKIVGRLVQ